MRLLALHTLGHDTGLCVFRDGELEFACESERVSRVPHDDRIDSALSYLWRRSGIRPEDIDHLAFSIPAHGALVDAADARSLADGVAEGRLHVDVHSRLLGRRLPCTLVVHEAAHAALGVHYAGRDRDCLVFVNEGWGAFSQNSTFVWRDGALALVGLDALPWYGTGFGWSTISDALGIGSLPSSPGKTMALAGYGEWSDGAAEAIVAATPSYVPSRHGWRIGEVDGLSGYLSAHPGFADRANFVHTFQRLFADEVVRHCREAADREGCAALALSGGCALNLSANSRVRRDVAAGVAIPPNCNDSGQAIGVALHCLDVRFGIRPAPFSVYRGGAALRPADGVDALRAAGFGIRTLDVDVVAERLADGYVVAFAQEASELGPRALGNRSLLASACVPGMRRRLSERLKGREWYRPLGCVTSSEAFASLLPGAPDSPHMLFSYDLPDGEAPEARHADGSSRIQTVDRTQNPRLWRLLRAYAAATGQRLLLNTSLNARGKPIASSTQDVLDDFLSTDIEAFVFDDVMALRDG